MAKKTEIQDQKTILWPDGWDRTRVKDRLGRFQWKNNREKYRAALIKELELMGAVSILITTSENERIDPGVAVWFSRAKEAADWQELLGLDNPAPTIAQIDDAFRERALKHHPDRGGDVAIYQKLLDARNSAKDWIRGTHSQSHEFVMALDLFDEARLNMAGLRLAISNLRSLRRLGMPSILERTLSKAFKAALPLNTGGTDGNDA